MVMSLASLLSVVAAAPLAAYVVLSPSVDHKPLRVLDTPVGRSLLVVALLAAFIWDQLVALLLLLAIAVFFIHVQALREGFGSYPSMPHIDWERKETVWQDGEGVIERPYAS